MPCLPYLRWYPSDFIHDDKVLGMTLEQIGLYIQALNYAWLQDGLPSDENLIFGLLLPKIEHVNGRKLSSIRKVFGTNWAVVCKCFAVSSDGKLRNERLEREREWSKQKSTNSKKALDFRYGKVSENEDFNDDLEPTPVDADVATIRTEQNRTEQKKREESDAPHVDFDTFLNLFCRHRGFKKPERRLRDIARMKWREIYLTDEKLGAALDGYYESDWGKAQSYPVLGFLKDPESWISVDAPKAQTFSVAVPRPEGSIPQPASSDAATGRETASTLPSTAEQWNQFVPSGPPVRIWKPNRWDKSDFDAVFADPDFRANLAGLLEKCERALQSGSKWVTFEWLLKNWGKVLNGSLGAGDAEKPKSRSGVVKSLLERRRREREAAEAEKAEKV